jgi:hypothetical protein
MRKSPEEKVAAREAKLAALRAQNLRNAEVSAQIQAANDVKRAAEDASPRSGLLDSAHSKTQAYLLWGLPGMLAWEKRQKQAVQHDEDR